MNFIQTRLHKRPRALEAYEYASNGDSRSAKKQHEAIKVPELGVEIVFAQKQKAQQVSAGLFEAVEA